MGKIGTLDLSGTSGARYTFNVYPYNTPFKAIGAVYYISKRTKNSKGTGTHSKIYIGQTDNLSKRFNNHHKEKCFMKQNANCISIFAEEDEDTRLAIESDLIDSLDPPCNGKI